MRNVPPRPAFRPEGPARNASAYAGTTPGSDRECGGAGAAHRPCSLACPRSARQARTGPPSPKIRMPGSRVGPGSLRQAGRDMWWRFAGEQSARGRRRRPSLVSGAGIVCRAAPHRTHRQLGDLPDPPQCLAKLGHGIIGPHRQHPSSRVRQPSSDHLRVGGHRQPGPRLAPRCPRPCSPSTPPTPGPLGTPPARP